MHPTAASGSCKAGAEDILSASKAHRMKLRWTQETMQKHKWAQAVMEEFVTGKDLGKNPVTSAWLQRKNQSFATKLCFNTSSPAVSVVGF